MQLPTSTNLLSPPLLPLPNPIPSVQPPQPVQSGIQASLSALESESQEKRMKRVQRDRNSVSTGRAYTRHVANYEKYWERLQERMLANNRNWVMVPAFPVTPMKASLFLEYELEREKVSISLTLACSLF